MVAMRGTPLGSLAAVVAGLALLAALPAPCACPSRPMELEHGCCQPPQGWSADTAVSCCPSSDARAEGRAAVPEGAAPAIASALVVPAWTPAAAVIPITALPEPPSGSPPLTVRRL
jgi:hypothetical protein